MGVRTTVTLDDDVVDGVKRESRSRGISFRDTLNDLLRTALSVENRPLRRTLNIKPLHMGYRTGLNYDDVESLLGYERHTDDFFEFRVEEVKPPTTGDLRAPVAGEPGPQLLRRELARGAGDVVVVGLGELEERIARELRVVVIEVAMNATFVAAIGHIELNADGHSQFESARIHLLDEHH